MRTGYEKVAISLALIYGPGYVFRKSKLRGKVALRHQQETRSSCQDFRLATSAMHLDNLSFCWSLQLILTFGIATCLVKDKQQTFLPRDRGLCPSVRPFVTFVDCRNE